MNSWELFWHIRMKEQRSEPHDHKSHHFHDESADCGVRRSFSALSYSADVFRVRTIHPCRWRAGTIMSGRKLGGGRIIGSGRSLSPGFPPRNASLLSPSTSSVSVNSSQTSQASTEPQDLSSRVSLEQNDDNAADAAAAASSRLVCPICNEDMVGLVRVREAATLMCSRSPCYSSTVTSTTITRI